LKLSRTRLSTSLSSPRLPSTGRNRPLRWMQLVRECPEMPGAHKPDNSTTSESHPYLGIALYFQRVLLCLGSNRMSA
jgi:hypothetical protein